MDPIIIMTNLPDRTSALMLAEKLIYTRLAACVSVLAECASVYRWQDKIETSSEVPIIIKTLAQHYIEIEKTIKKVHSDELPEIITVPISGGLPAYLQWIVNETTLLEKN